VILGFTDLAIPTEIGFDFGLDAGIIFESWLRNSSTSPGLQADFQLKASLKLF